MHTENTVHGTARALRLALLNDYEVVLLGIQAMLQGYADRIQIVASDTDRSVTQPVDITLFDTFSQSEAGDEAIRAVLGQPEAGKVVVFTWNIHPDLVQPTLDLGAAGVLGKTLSASELVLALESIAAGETVVSPSPGTGAEEAGPGDPSNRWPGKEHGLSLREAEVLSLITCGFSNQDIAERLYLSINSVKTYIRSAYQKIGVTSRTNAVLWGVSHGLTPDRPQHSSARRAR